jgi:hypothetical protein
MHATVARIPVAMYRGGGGGGGCRFHRRTRTTFRHEPIDGGRIGQAIGRRVNVHMMRGTDGAFLRDILPQLGRLGPGEGQRQPCGKRCGGTERVCGPAPRRPTGKRKGIFPVRTIP